MLLPPLKVKLQLELQIRAECYESLFSSAVTKMETTTSLRVIENNSILEVFPMSEFAFERDIGWILIPLNSSWGSRIEEIGRHVVLTPLLRTKSSQ